jgi:predicted ester cyclase
MSNLRLPCSTLVIALLAFGLPDAVLAAQVDDAEAIALATPRELIVSEDITPPKLQEILRPVEAFYGFWNNGSDTLLSAALGKSFTDHTLPPGREQGPEGPAAASKAFLAAVPDLKVTVIQRIVASDRVVSHLWFTGHFTGSFRNVAGKGQPIRFIATDILRVRDGKITDNWHLEDNLTFLTQIGVIPK